MPVFPIIYTCNNKCVMCSNPEYSEKDNRGCGLKDLKKRLKGFYVGKEVFLENFRDGFCLTGGEPTLSSHLAPLIEEINKFFPGTEILCLTNGRKFSRPVYARKVLATGANLHLATSIHAYNAKLHDRITGIQGSFAQTVKGLDNIRRFKKSNHKVSIRVVIHGLNYKFLDRTARFINDNFSYIDRMVFIFFEIEGRAEKNIKTLKLRYGQVRPYVNKLYGLISKFKEVRFYHFPLCTLSVVFYPYIWRTLPDYEVSFGKSCRSCKLKKFCLGIHKGYIEHFGTKEFRPPAGKISIGETGSWYHPIESVRVLHPRTKKVLEIKPVDTGFR